MATHPGNLPKQQTTLHQSNCAEKNFFPIAGLVAGDVLLKEHQISKNKEQKMAFSTPIKEHLIPILAEAMDTEGKKSTLQVEQMLSL